MLQHWVQLQVHPHGSEGDHFLQEWCGASRHLFLPFHHIELHIFNASTFVVDSMLRDYTWDVETARWVLSNTEDIGSVKAAADKIFLDSHGEEAAHAVELDRAPTIRWDRQFETNVESLIRVKCKFWLIIDVCMIFRFQFLFLLLAVIFI